MNACLRHTTTGWHLGFVTPDPLIDNFDRPVRVDELASLLPELGLGVGSVDVREDVPAEDIETVLAVVGKRTNSLARFTAPRLSITAQEG